MIRTLLTLLAAISAACSAPVSVEWLAEDESGAATISVRGDTLEITALAGLMLWYPHPLLGDYRISYTATVLMQEGSHDRLADLNCFWAASDPQYPGDLFARSAWRKGTFARYNSLHLFYVGYGGNNNTTTRFRKYPGDRYNTPGAEVKPLLGEYTGAAHLLAPNHPLHITITVRGRRTAFAVNGKELFSRALIPDEGDGYFGLRLLENHTLISGFKIEYL